MSEGILTLTDSEFDSKVIKSERPVLVDFWAEWCAPCRALTPVVEEISKQFEGKLDVAKMNIDDHPEAPGRYAVKAIPTLLIFKGGAVVDQVVGLISKAKLEQVINKHVA